MRKLWLKWSLLVGLSAVVSFAFGLGVLSTPAFIIGMVAGIACFIMFYVWLDNKLILWQRPRWRKALLLGVVIKMLLQVWPMIEMYCGIVSLAVLDTLFGQSIPLFWHGFLGTLGTGTLLSLVVGIFTALSYGVLGLWQRTMTHSKERV
ncbi:hypothetical protein [Spirabiliibacterium falconis]|uniref:hypothetical protein n=1 Tax=Spirabiliibacterium falconis TaxID=572023 RepID=UPI001AAD1AE5|nr:hypothetical protein [Spirabiliibacterium falconis]MBE2893531.1 hypothetical protein [Spirabiliibacterium falconis]